jgi:hypothetical protein
MVGPRESARLRQLYLASAHLKALARAFGRDERTVVAALRREGIPLRQDLPLSTAWHVGLSTETHRALQSYFADLQQREERAWQQLLQAALEQTARGFVFASHEEYAAILRTAEPSESLEDLACRLCISLNRVLLAYAAWWDEVEAQPGHTAWH